jgi:hypothetical protein
MLQYIQREYAEDGDIDAKGSTGRLTFQILEVQGCSHSLCMHHQDAEDID